MSFLLTCPNCGTREVTDFGFGGEVSERPAAASQRARAEHLRVLPPQRRRRAARVVVPPLRVPRLVPGRARHRAPTRCAWTALPGGASRGEPPRPRSRASASTALARSASRFDGRRCRLRRRHDRQRADGRRPPGVLALVQVPPPARRAVRLRPCANSLVDVDGRPGIRGCSEPARDGMRRAPPERVAVAGARRDGADRPPRPAAAASASTTRRSSARGGCGRCTRRCCARPPAWAAWPSARTSARGAPSTAAATATCSSSAAGWPGCGAALEAAQAGADVVLCDEDAEPGGQALVDGRHERGARAGRRRRRAAGVEILSRAPALGFFDGLVAVWQDSTLHQVRAARCVLATGAIQQPLVFPGNDRPGVMLSGGARRAWPRCTPWRRAAQAVVADGRRPRPGGRARAARGRDRGRRRRRPARRPPTADRPRASRRPGIRLLRGATVVRADGRRARAGRAAGRRRRRRARASARPGRIACDLLAVAGPAQPSLSLLLQAGGRAAYDPASRGLRGRRGRPTASRRSGAWPGRTPPARWPRRRRWPPTARRERQGVRRPRRGRHRQGHRATRRPRASTAWSCPSATRR